YRSLNLESVFKQRGGKIAPSTTPTVSGAVLTSNPVQKFPPGDMTTTTGITLAGKYYFAYSYHPYEIMSPMVEFTANQEFSSITFTNLEYLKGYTRIFYISRDKQQFYRIDALYGDNPRQSESPKL